MISSQSKTTITKISPPTDTTTTTSETQTQEQQHEQQHQQQHKQEQNKRLQLHNSDSDFENDLEEEKYNQENKDDWKVNDNNNANKKDINIIVPSFIRLFVIRRVIDRYITSNNDNKNDTTTEEIIKKLANGFEENKKTESLVINIVTRLIDDGIKKYMSKYYDEKEQANIIEDIFTKIILKKFEKEYYQMIEYKTNSAKTDDNYYQNLLFNSSDLMSQIFQYLEWGQWFCQDLYSCSLVSSYWLYHVWNPSSVYYIDIHQLVEHDMDNNQKCARKWQRLYHAKSIRIRSPSTNKKAAIPTVNKLSMFRKVEKVDIHVFDDKIGKSIPLVIPIMRRYKDRIKYCRICISHSQWVPWHLTCTDFKAPSPLRLPKAQYVEIGDLLFYRQWTNECTQLKLFEVKKIDKDWCKFVIENCDCSNVVTLKLGRVKFDYYIDKVILKQFALKFCNLKTFEIEFISNFDDSVLLFWQLLKPILSKNKSKVKLTVIYLGNEDASSLSQRMDEKDLKINKLVIDCMRDDTVNSAIKLIQERDYCGLDHLAIEGAMMNGKKLLDELECKSINKFELIYHNIKFVNELLEWKMIVEKQIFVIIDVCAYHWNFDNKDQVLSFFKQLYENVYRLFVQQIALDIKIKCKSVKDLKLLHSYLSMYLSYFESKKFLSQYNSPNCNNNNLCLPRDKPYTYFYMHDSKKEKYFVFCASNVRMK